MQKSQAQTEKRTSQPQQFNRDQFIIHSVIIYNPKFKPQGLKKAYEEDFQDAKLLFYYPKHIIDINMRRNHVGLAEGTLKFIQMQKPTDDENKFQIIKANDYVHINKEVEPDYWLALIVKLSQNYTRFLYKQGKKRLVYLHDEVLSTQNDEIPDQILRKFMDHFYTQFTLFYGKISSKIDNQKIPEQDEQSIINFIVNYRKLTASSKQHIFNTQRFQYKYLLYPHFIQKKQFMSLQYLMHMLQCIDKKIKHQILFYKGYFIYSTLPHGVTQTFYDYFYTGGRYFEPGYSKIKYRFQQIISDKDDGGMLFGKINPVENTKKGSKGYIYGWLKEIQQQQLKSQQSKNQKLLKNKVQIKYTESKFPLINLGGDLGKYKMSAYTQNGILLLSFYKKNYQIQSNKFTFNQIQTTLEKNLKFLTASMDKDLQMIENQKQKTHLIIYFNKDNLAFKCLPYNFKIENLDKQTKKLLMQLMAEIQDEEDLYQVTSKTLQYWITGLKANERILFILFPGVFNLEQVAAETRKITSRFFGGIYL